MKSSRKKNLGEELDNRFLGFTSTLVHLSMGNNRFTQFNSLYRQELTPAPSAPCVLRKHTHSYEHCFSVNRTKFYQKLLFFSKNRSKVKNRSKSQKFVVPSTLAPTTFLASAEKPFFAVFFAV